MRSRLLLRSETASCHARLDSLLDALDLSTSGDYADFLRGQAPAMALEAALEAGNVAALLPDWPGRRRTGALQADLAGLGLATKIPFVAPIADKAAQLGTLYVLEGSRLGARLLLERALRSPDPGVRAATRYLSHGRAEPFWPLMVARLDAADGEDLDPSAMILAARMAFGHFIAAAEAVMAGRCPRPLPTAAAPSTALLPAAS